MVGARICPTILWAIFERLNFSFQVPRNPDLGSDAERVRKDEQKKIDESEVLSEEEIAEKEDLLKQVIRFCQMY